MSKEFPNKNLKNLICDMFSNIPSIELDFESIVPQKSWSHDGGDKGEDWKFLFKKKDSSTVLEISVHIPSNHVFVAFTRGDLWFSFDNYLSSIGKRKELDDITAKVITDMDNFSSQDCAIEILKVFKKYLLSDLVKVARGEEWKNIPIDWTGIR